MNGLTRKLIIFALVMAMVALGGWLGRKAWKHYTEQSLIAQAKQYIAQKDWRNTDICLRRVLQVNPMSVEGGRLVADILDLQGSPEAVSWRIRVAKLQPNNVTNYLTWVNTALREKNIPSALEGLGVIPEKYRNTPEYYKLAGAVAWSSGHPVEAEKDYSTALKLEPGNPAIIFNLATVHLASTNPVVASEGRSKLVQLADDPKVGKEALEHLLTDATNRKNYSEALEYSARIVNAPSVTFADKIEYLQLARLAKSSQAASWLAALKQNAAGSADEAYELGRWIVLEESPQTALTWLRSLPPDTETNQLIQLIITDCQIDLKDWGGLLSTVRNQDWKDQEFYRLALVSRAQESLGKATDSDLAWDRALNLAEEQPQSIAQLAEVAKNWGWLARQEQSLGTIVTKYPDQQWALEELTGLLYNQGKTKELSRLLSQAQSANPGDMRLQNNLANVLLLRKSEIQPEELSKAFRMAQAAYESATNNPFYISTYAYSLLLQNKPGEAAKIATELKPEYLKIPSVAVYYGVVEAEVGHKDQAREPLVWAQAAGEKGKLLPEERDIIKSAIARL